MSLDKLGQMGAATDEYAANNGGTYEDQIKQKIIDLVMNNYPWLGDFNFDIIEHEPGESFAYGAAKLKGFSDGFDVEFPIVYTDGDILEIPAFLLPDRNLKLPFTEKFYKLITSSLNNTDNIGKIRERDDISESMVGMLNATDYKPVSEVMKLSSLTRVLATLPRRVVRSYAKKACKVFPDLTRDFYSALSLSRVTANVKQAGAKKLSDKTASMGGNPVPGNTSSNSLRSLKESDKMISIASPVFLSEAEYKEKGGVVEGTNIVKVLDKIFVMPEANSKVSVYSIPSFEEVTKSLSSDFELMSPGDIATKIGYRLKTAPNRPAVISCPSTLQDYWLVSGINTSTRYGDDYYGNSSSDRESVRSKIVKVNQLGGELLDYVESAENIDLDERVEGTGKRVCYFPEKIELARYLQKILNTPLNIYKHDITKIMCSNDKIPVRNESGRVFLLPLRGGSMWMDNDTVTKQTEKNGEVNITFYNHSTMEEDTLAAKVVADKATGAVNKIYYNGRHIPSDFINNDEDGSLLVLDMSDVLTYDPDVYTLADEALVPLNHDSDGMVRQINFYGYNDLDSKTGLPTSNVRSLIRKLFNVKDLDPSFLLNTLGASTREQPDFSIPYINVHLRRNKDVVLSVPEQSKNKGGPTAVKFFYPETEDMVSALAHIGILPEDLKSIDSEVKTAVANLPMDGTKLSYALTPAMGDQGVVPGISSEEILQQAMVILNDLKANQDAMRSDADAREAYTDKQLSLIETKLESVEELKDILANGVPQEQAPVEGQIPMENQVPTGEQEPKKEQAPVPTQTASPEVVNRMAEALLDPAVAEQLGLSEEDLGVLTAASQGDEQAATEVGFTPGDQVLFMRLAMENDQGAASGLAPEDIEMIASIMVDPEGAVAEGGMEQALVEKVMAAAQGDPAAMEELGIADEDMQIIMVKAEELQASEGGAGMEGQPGMEGQLGMEGGEEAPPPPDPEETFNQAMSMVKAYLDPMQMEELGVEPEDLGYVTLVVRSPEKALMSGVPGEMVQAISDAYEAVTGKSVYQSAEVEFNNAPDMNGNTPNINTAKNVISNSKGFEEYSKPLAETSVLLDLIPKVKTAKLFFKNSDAFRSMLSIMGDILINMQLNAIQYRDSMGPDAYDKILSKTKKTYDAFGNMILDMYSLDKADN